MGLEYVSDNFWFVFFAYAAAFAPWTAIAAKDFISSTWKTVRKTRLAGYSNLFWSFIPALYVIAYCVIKGASRDYTETCAALIASVFAVLHMLRTLWGLWQLEQFRSWAENSILALEAMGIKYGLPMHHHGLEEYRRREDGEMSAADISDHLLVNDKVIDNQIMHGEVHCYLRYGREDLLTQQEGDPELFSHFLAAIRWIRVIGMFLYDVVLRLFGRKSHRRLKLVPMKPIAVWVHWATSFASQGLRDWIGKFDVTQDPKAKLYDLNSSAMDKLCERGAYFPSEVLASAALQLWSESETTDGDLNPFLWPVWDEDSNMCDGRAVKHELFRIAVSKGDALPFCTSHENDLMASKARIVGLGYLSYDSYREALAKFITELPVDSVFLEEIRKFDVEKLEWLTIVLHLGSLSRGVNEVGQTTGGKGDSEGMSDGYDPKSNEKSSHLGNDSDSHPSTTDSSELMESEKCADNRQNEQAVSNLRAQLNLTGEGLRSKLGAICCEGPLHTEEAIMSAFPIDSSLIWDVSEGNRLVTKVGELIDVWLALVSGEQTLFLVENLNAGWSDYCLGPGEKGSCLQEDEAETSDKLQGIHCQVEKRRLRWRVADERHRYEFHDQFLTFMGYRMESVRTTIARWVSANEGKDANEFFESATACSDSGHGISSEEQHVSIELSESLTRLLRSNIASAAKRRSVQCRLIWELQSALEKRTLWCSSTSLHNEDCDVSLAVAILLILAFPSLDVQVIQENEEEEDEKGCHRVELCCIKVDNSARSSATAKMECPKECSLKLKISPVCGPQKCWVVGDIYGGQSCTLRLCTSGKFVWRWWRDAFLGRLQGLKEWQGEHEIRSIELLMKAPRSGIEELRTATGNVFRTWKEWIPFRTEFCRFELESEEFLRQPCITGEKTPFIQDEQGTTCQLGTFPVKKVQAVEYDDAQDVVLMHCSVLVADAIRNADYSKSMSSEQSSDETAADALLDMADEEEPKRALMLYEMAAMQYGNIGALKKSIELLIAARTGSENISRGPNMLQSYVAMMLSSRAVSLELCAQDQNKMDGDIAPLLKKLLQKWGDHGAGYMPLTRVLQVYLASDPTSHCSIAFGQLRLAAFLNEGREKSLAALHDLEISIDCIETAHAGDENIVSLLAFDLEDIRRRDFSRENCRARLHIMQKALRDGELIVSGSEGPGLENGKASIHKTKYSAIHSNNHKLIRKELGKVMNSLAVILEKGAEGVTMDLTRAVKLYERAVDEGSNTDAMYNLALLLRYGEGVVSADVKRAVELYELAAKRNHGTAMNNLARILEQGVPGEGIEADVCRAVELYEQAINECNEVLAMTNLGRLLELAPRDVERDTRRASQLYERAIEEGKDVEAMWRLASMLEDGTEDVEKDVRRAIELYQRAYDEEKDMVAWHSLVRILRMDDDAVNRDMARVVALYQDAIDDGRLEEICNLAFILEKGPEGVEKDVKRAMELYERAHTEARDIYALRNLVRLVRYGAEGLDKDIDRAVALYQEAIDEGYVKEMYALAVMLIEGTEMDVDVSRAKSLIRAAVQTADSSFCAWEDMRTLREIFAKGTKEVPKDIEIAKAILERAKADNMEDVVATEEGKASTEG